ncbi:MAG: cytochrome c maturation protein CcmE [Polyangiaceae bacterium]|nr:cytochrome c maturation protein CcmE [Polyangiaceae bacterium]
MSNLDDELAKAIEEPAPPVAKPIPKPASAQKEAAARASIGLLVALVVIVGAIVLVVMFGFKDAAIYALPVKDLAAQQDKYVGRKIRLEGELTPGTLKKRDQPCEYRFTVQGGPPDGAQHQIPVRYGQCVVPDTFRDMPGGGVQVTVEGALTKEGHFEATLVMAKCSSKYDPATHQMTKDRGEAAATPIN